MCHLLFFAITCCHQNVYQNVYLITTVIFGVTKLLRSELLLTKSFSSLQWGAEWGAEHGKIPDRDFPERA